MKRFSRRVLLALSLSIFAFGLTACGGGGSSSTSSVEEPSSVASVSTGAHTVYVPDGVSIDSSVEGDFNGAAIFAGSDSLGEATVSIAMGPSLRVSTTSLSSRDVAGFIAQRPMFNGEADASAALVGFQTSLGSLYLGTLSNTGTQALGTAAVVASYDVTLTAPSTVTAVAKTIAETIGANTDGGSITNFPAANPNETLTDEFQLFMGVVYTSEDDVILLVAVVPKAVAGSYYAITSGTVNPGNVGGANATPTATTQTFTANSGSGKADFLFVVDSSGSMYDDQVAVSQAASDFLNVIQSSGLDYQLGVISTGDYYADQWNGTLSDLVTGDTLHDTAGDGGFTNDAAEFANDVKVGDYGAATETGIYYAEKALQSTAAGDSEDGSVTQAGHPRTGASMSVVVVSDEPDQYCYVGSYQEFDLADNLFLNRGYKVFAIMTDPTDPYYYQPCTADYDDLANATGGSVADITDLTAIQSIMTNIAYAAGGSTSMYVLSHIPTSGSIAVTVDGAAVVNSTTNGWVYNAASNSIVFYGTAIPAGGATVEISYEYL